MKAKVIKSLLCHYYGADRARVKDGRLQVLKFGQGWQDKLKSRGEAEAVLKSAAGSYYEPLREWIKEQLR